MEKQAWIQDPKTANTARFHWDPKSWSADPMYFVDSGRPLIGAPPLLKTRRHMKRDAARKLWRKLQEQGWRQVKPQWGGTALIFDPRKSETTEKRKQHRPEGIRRQKTQPDP